MFEITWEALPNGIIITLSVYIYFHRNKFSRNFNLPQEITCKNSESGSNRQLLGVTGILSVTLDKLKVIVHCGNIKQ